MNTIRHEVLKEMVTEWKNATSVETRKKLFHKILAKIDKLLIYTVSVCVRNNKRLIDENRQELYHTAIIGLHRAIETAKDGDDGARIQARIMSYVKEEIRKTFLKHKNVVSTVSIETVEEDLTSKQPEFTDIEVSEVCGKIDDLISCGDISWDDYNMMIDNIIKGIPYSKIARERHLHYTTVSRRIRKIKDLIKTRICPYD
jgi:hypothetical protein